MTAPLFNFAAPGLNPNFTFVAQAIGASGNTYNADKNGVIKNVASNDFVSAVDSGCVSLGLSAVLSNFSATSAPTTANDNTQDYGVGSRWLNKTTGIEYVCSDATTNAAQWTTNGSGNCPWVTGQFYGTPDGATQAAVLTVLGTLYAYPVFIPSKVTLSSINMSVTTGQTGGKARAALFYDNGAGYPGAIVPSTDTGDLAGTATAVVTKGSLTTILAPGVYWIGSIYTASSTMPSVIGSTATYSNGLSSAIGFDTAAHALATSGEAATGISITGQTYPATNMTTSFPTFPSSATLSLNVTTPIVALGV